MSFAWRASPYLSQAFILALVLLLCPTDHKVYSKLRTCFILLTNFFLCTYNLLVGLGVLPPPGGRSIWPLPKQTLGHLALSSCIWKVNKAVSSQLHVPLASLVALLDFCTRLPGLYDTYHGDFHWAAAATSLGVMTIVCVSVVIEWRQRSLFLAQVKRGDDQDKKIK